MNTFDVRTRIMLGDSLARVAADFKRIFIVTDRFMAESGKISYVTDRLGCETDYEIFSDIAAEPDIDTITCGAGALLAFSPDATVAFGGGSSIDAAKAMLFFSAEAGRTGSHTLIAIPTTSGTGSEVSKISVITDPKSQIKHPLIDDRLIPDVAVLDAALVISAPATVTADAVMDILTHAIEAYVSTKANDFSKAAAEKAIKMALKDMLMVYRQPENLDARQKIHNASSLAGIAFSHAGLGLVHSMAHAIGAKYRIPHGRANAILLPYVMSFNAGCADHLTPVAEEYAEISRMIGLEAVNTRQSALNLIRTVRNNVRQMDIPRSIREAGISANDFNEALLGLTEAAFLDRCTSTNPRKCTRQEIAVVFHKAYIGKMP